MSNRSKGRRTELELAQLFEQAGWHTYLVPPPKKYNLTNDIFHLFDMIAIKGKRKKWIQIKTNRKPVLKPFEEWAGLHACRLDQVEVWVRKDNKPESERWITYEMEEEE